jgi:membrane protein DedA with SNARE-associated domain
MEVAQPFIAFLTGHVHLAVFAACAIEATGIPFPSRILLILAGVFLASTAGLAWAVVLAAAGAVLGDHVLYLSGRCGGPSLLRMYCRLTLGSERCVEDTVAYFARFGAPAIVLGRFSTGVRSSPPSSAAVATSAILDSWRSTSQARCSTHRSGSPWAMCSASKSWPS